jgi:Tfp pilus assembly protein PilV
MDRMMHTYDCTEAASADQRGFSLIEVLAAMFILMAGLLPLVGMFTIGVKQMTASTPMLVAREKAREAIESVHAARDTEEASWPTIRNQSDGGIFLDGAQTIKLPGADGLVNTADDGAAELPAAQYRREIDISPLNFDGGGPVNPNLREVKVTVSYKVYGGWRTYVMTTYVSSYS